MPSQNRSLKPDKTSLKDLSTGSLSYTTDYARSFKLESVSLHASVSITETVTVTLDSVNGSNYDMTLKTEDLVGEQDFVFRPTGEINLQAGDEIKVTCTNANLTGTVFVVVKASELTK